MGRFAWDEFLLTLSMVTAAFIGYYLGVTIAYIIYDAGATISDLLDELFLAGMLEVICVFYTVYFTRKRMCHRKGGRYIDMNCDVSNKKNAS